MVQGKVAPTVFVTTPKRLLINIQINNSSNNNKIYTTLLKVRNLHKHLFIDIVKTIVFFNFELSKHLSNWRRSERLGHRNDTDANIHTFLALWFHFNFSNMRNFNHFRVSI